MSCCKHPRPAAGWRQYASHAASPRHATAGSTAAATRSFTSSLSRSPRVTWRLVAIPVSQLGAAAYNFQNLAKGHMVRRLEGHRCGSPVH